MTRMRDHASGLSNNQLLSTVQLSPVLLARRVPNKHSSTKHETEMGKSYMLSGFGYTSGQVFNTVFIAVNGDCKTCGCSVKM